jgi:ankyrin repeat protein
MGRLDIANARTRSDVLKLRSRYGDAKLLAWVDKKGGTLIHALATNGAGPDAIEAALDLKIDPNAQRRSDKNTALHLARFHKNDAAAKALLEVTQGDIMNQFGETAAPGASSY